MTNSKHNKVFQLSFYIIVPALVGILVGWAFNKNPTLPTRGSDTAKVEELPILPLEEAFPHVLKKNTTLFASLRELNIEPQDIHQIVEAAKPLRNLSRLRPGTRFQTNFKNSTEENETPELLSVHFRFSALESLLVRKNGETWVAEEIIEPVDIKVVTYSGVVTSSLWESAQRVKMDPQLISELADIFAWEVDFAREVRANDRWRLTVEQKLVRGHPIGWGSILAAEYENAGTSHKATLFRLDGEDVGYFTPEGASLRKMFLKSPLRFGRITSRFNMGRFHPILKTRRPHLGVDYGAPIGTPVMAVGDGTIVFAGWSGGGGNVIKLRHNSQYQTAYKHLSRFAKGIRNGVKVRQGQVIGYVGNTGLSTGPHLHFEFYQAGRYLDPLRKKFPSADPVPSEHIEQFKAESDILLSALPDWDNRELATAQTHPEITEKSDFKKQ